MDFEDFLRFDDCCADKLVDELTFVSSPDVILCGWLGSNHQLPTTYLPTTYLPTLLSCTFRRLQTVDTSHSKSTPAVRTTSSLLPLYQILSLHQRTICLLSVYSAVSSTLVTEQRYVKMICSYYYYSRPHFTPVLLVLLPTAEGE